MSESLEIKQSFCKQKGKTRWKELTRQDMNEYYRIYYSKHKERYTQYKIPGRCEICDMEVKNTYNHNRTKRHLMIEGAILKCKPQPI